MASNLCQPLPERYMKGLDVVGSEKGHKKDQPTELKDFFANKLPPGDRKEVAGEFKKTLVLAAQRPKKGKGLQVRKSKKQLTAKERRNLGLFRPPPPQSLVWLHEGAARPWRLGGHRLETRLERGAATDAAADEALQGGLPWSHGQGGHGDLPYAQGCARVGGDGD